MVRQETGERKGILALLNLRVIPFPQETVDLVTDFYENEGTNRIMPGKRDFLSVITD